MKNILLLIVHFSNMPHNATHLLIDPSHTHELIMNREKLSIWTRFRNSLEISLHILTSSSCFNLVSNIRSTIIIVVIIVSRSGTLEASFQKSEKPFFKKKRKVVCILKIWPYLPFLDHHHRIHYRTNATHTLILFVLHTISTRGFSVE
jgi:small-conductance mechanosensitive channel